MVPDVMFPARNLRLLHAATALALAVMAVIGWVGLPDPAARVLALSLCLGFGVVYVLAFRAAPAQRRTTVYLAAQTLLVSLALTRLNDQTGTYSFLFIILGVQAALLLSGRQAVFWLAVYFAITSLLILQARGAAGLVNILFNGAAYGMVGLLIAALHQAELARRQNQRLLEELRAAHDQLRDYAEQAKQAAVGEERSRLARDLHDSVKQQLFALLMQLGAARARLDDSSAARSHVDEAEGLARQAGTELAALIHTLHPAALSNQSLPEALRAHVSDWSRQCGIAADLELEPQHPLPPAVENAFFRIAQESLSNVARHSAAERVTVRLLVAGGQARLLVHDNGRGFGPAAAAGVGLGSMAERMAAVGGQFQVESALGRGTQVTATYAYEEQPQ
jgi:signal transduction histidine kinase